MNSKATFIDTNIFMYARGKAHPYKDYCSQIILSIAKGEFLESYGSPVIDVEVFQEILYRYALIGRWDIGISVCQDIALLGLEVIPVDFSDISRTLELAKAYGKEKVTPRDLIHAAVMLNHGIERILSTDKHFDLIREIKRVDPKKIRIKLES